MAQLDAESDAGEFADLDDEHGFESGDGTETADGELEEPI